MQVPLSVQRCSFWIVVHIGCIQGETAAHPVPFVEEDNNKHDPLAPNDGNTKCKRDNEVHNSNISKDWQVKNDFSENWHSFVPAIEF